MDSSYSQERAALDLMIERASMAGLLKFLRESARVASSLVKEEEIGHLNHDEIQALSHIRQLANEGAPLELLVGHELSMLEQGGEERDVQDFYIGAGFSSFLYFLFELRSFLQTTDREYVKLCSNAVIDSVDSEIDLGADTRWSEIPIIKSELDRQKSLLVDA